MKTEEQNHEEEITMKNTFYRPETINTEEMEMIIGKLLEDFRAIRGGAVSEEEAKEYVKKMLQDAKALPKNDQMYFLGFASPEMMPSDSRVLYFYRPTYISCAILLQIKLQNMKEVLSLEGFEEIFRKLLHGATGRGFLGAGHEGLKGLMSTLELFEEAGVSEFLAKYPEDAPEFSKAFQAAVDYLAWKCRGDVVRSDWGEDYTEEAKILLKKLRGEEDMVRIFVYGTLMKGNRNHEAYLAGSRYLGEAQLMDYALYHLGSYPGIREEKDSTVKGEVYEITRETLQRIHHLEGEGQLYSYREVSVWQQGTMLYPVGTYVYLHEVEKKNKVALKDQPWVSKEDLIWYVSYGSNMLLERFRFYLEGGSFRGIGRMQEECSDRRLPRRKKSVTIPFDMYYGGRSSSWEGKGVSFLDTTKPGKAYGVAYLVTKTQYQHILREENGGNEPDENFSWYGLQVRLKEIEGIPAMTFTSKVVKGNNDAGPLYKSVLLEGLLENYPKVEKALLEAYVENRNRNR